ncbi:MAG: SMC-Scp complex subunit ScpB [Oscillospiraceae bacterium]
MPTLSVGPLRYASPPSCPSRRWSADHHRHYQPTTRSYVDQIRGVDSSYTVGLLLDRHLIEECGPQVPGRPRLYRTTKRSSGVPPELAGGSAGDAGDGGRRQRVWRRTAPCWIMQMRKTAV